MERGRQSRRNDFSFFPAGYWCSIIVVGYVWDPFGALNEYFLAATLGCFSSNEFEVLY